MARVSQPFREKPEALGWAAAYLPHSISFALGYMIIIALVFFFFSVALMERFERQESQNTN